MGFRLDDYIDGDVAYLAGLIVGRGTLSESEAVRSLTIQFPHTSLEMEGVSSTFDQQTAIQLGLMEVRERLLELLATDIQIVTKDTSVDFVIRFLRQSMVWRNLLLLTGGAMSYEHFRVPEVFFDEKIPRDWKREFVRGYADVAGNIRRANRYIDGRNRVRLDVLNHRTNWEVPVQLCRLLQEELEVPVQLITWGHPNLGRGFREHQINIFATEFLEVGFGFNHKQTLLEEFVDADVRSGRAAECRVCPGRREVRGSKPADEDESNGAKLDERLVGNHFDAYWQICKALGCTRTPTPDEQMSLEFVDEAEPDTDEGTE